MSQLLWATVDYLPGVLGAVPALVAEAGGGLQGAEEAGVLLVEGDGLHQLGQLVPGLGRRQVVLGQGGRLARRSATISFSRK